MEKLHHVAIVVPDIEKAVNWYTVNFDTKSAYVDDSWALLNFDNIRLALVLPDHHPPHIAVERDDADRYGALTPHRDGMESIYVSDPWGNTIEFMQTGESGESDGGAW